jgi:CubicO group peptidase (beta-lactamase class C family)
MSAATAPSQPPATATETDPETLGWMKGFPPSPDRTISFQDRSFRNFPELRWAWSNIRQLVPTVNVWRGAGPASVLPRQDHDIGASASTTMDGRPMTFAKMLEETYADGIVVLHRGRLIYERYFGALKPHKPHIAMSVTKSFTGVLAGILVAEGKIDPQAPVTEYVPELKASAFGDARVHEVMDMTTGLEYTEVYTDKNSHVWGCGAPTAWRRFHPTMTVRPPSLISWSRRRSRASTARPLPTRPSTRTCWPGSSGASAA